MNGKGFSLVLLLCLTLLPTGAAAFHDPGYGQPPLYPTAFCRREIMDLNFSTLEMSAMFVSRLKKTPTDLLDVLGKRAAFTVQHDDSAGVVWSAHKVLDVLRRLGVTVPGGDNPPPPPPPPPTPPTPPTPPEPPTPPTPPTPPPPTPPTPPPPPPPEPPTPPPPTPPTPPPPPPTPPTPPTPPPPPPPPDIGNGPPIAPGEEFPIVDYYPVNIGDHWKYVDLAVNNTIFTMDIRKTITSNGRQAFFNERNDKIETDALTTDEDGMLLHEQQRTNSDGSLFHAIWTPPVKFSDIRTKLGERYSTVPSFTNPGTGNHMQWVSTVFGIQDVTVPAG
ncbi:MAG: hypothetical protein HY303_21005, partial [Candidatus Wallbacteria bacterium]|nr:hypothetical protein [Candidatus Wallbacteria bacterium]